MPRQHANPPTKQSQRAKAQTYLVHQREARVLAGQLPLPFASQVDVIQASDAETRIQTPKPVSRKPEGKQTYIYNYLRWAGR